MVTSENVTSPGYAPEGYQTLRLFIQPGRRQTAAPAQSGFKFYFFLSNFYFKDYCASPLIQAREEAAGHGGSLEMIKLKLREFVFVLLSYRVTTETDFNWQPRGTR